MCARAKERYYTPTPTHPHTRLIMSNMCACATHPPKKKTKNAFRGVEIREIYQKKLPLWRQTHENAKTVFRHLAFYVKSPNLEPPMQDGAR